MAFIHTTLIYYNKNNHNSDFIIKKYLSVIINNYLRKSKIIIL